MFNTEYFNPTILSDQVVFGVIKKGEKERELFKFDAQTDDKGRFMYNVSSLSYLVESYFKKAGSEVEIHKFGNTVLGLIKLPENTADNKILVFGSNGLIKHSFTGYVVSPGVTVAKIPDGDVVLNLREYYELLGAKIKWEKGDASYETKIYLKEKDETPRTQNFDFLGLSGKNLYHKNGFLGEGVIVAVLDTGVSNHPELEDRILKGTNTNTYYGNSTESYEDDGGHGTHVAGSIAGKTCGVAPKAKILPVKVLHPTLGANWGDLIRGLEYVRDWKSDSGERVDIVNMSLGAPESYAKSNPAEFEKFHSLVKELVDMGISVICASGNTGREGTQYPAHFEEVVCVGAVDVDKKVANFSTRNNEVDVSQVGVDVISAYYKGGFAKFSGTSMATPIVSGIAALLICKYKSIFKKYMPETVIYESLKLSTIDIGMPGICNATGAGFCSLNPNPINIEILKNGAVKVNDDIVALPGKPYFKDDDVRIFSRRVFEEMGALVKSTPSGIKIKY